MYPLFPESMWNGLVAPLLYHDDPRVSLLTAKLIILVYTLYAKLFS